MFIVGIDIAKRSHEAIIIAEDGQVVRKAFSFRNNCTGYNLLLEQVRKLTLATVYKGNIIKNLIMDCQSYTKYRPNETTGGIFVSWRRKEELPTGA